MGKTAEGGALTAPAYCAIRHASCHLLRGTVRTGKPVFKRHRSFEPLPSRQPGSRLVTLLHPPSEDTNSTRLIVLAQPVRASYDRGPCHHRRQRRLTGGFRWTHLRLPAAVTEAPGRQDQRLGEISIRRPGGVPGRFPESGEPADGDTEPPVQGAASGYGRIRRAVPPRCGVPMIRGLNAETSGTRIRFHLDDDFISPRCDDGPDPFIRSDNSTTYPIIIDLGLVLTSPLRHPLRLKHCRP